MTLRDEIVALIAPDGRRARTPEWIADRILAIPALRDALLLMDTATRRFGEAARNTDPADYMMGFMNAHPWANLLKPEDMPTEAPPPAGSAE